MKSKLVFIGSLLLTSMFMSACSSKKCEKINEQPNVLFIMCDDLNDYSGAFGGHPQVKTPNIDKLAKSATVFTNAHSNVPVCQPSRNSLFTGVYPHTSKDFGWTPHYKNPILKHCKTFIEFSMENGYRVMSTGKLLHKNVRSIWDEWGGDERINYGPFAYNGTKIVGHPSVKEPFRSINIVMAPLLPCQTSCLFPMMRLDPIPLAGLMVPGLSDTLMMMTEI